LTATAAADDTILVRQGRYQAFADPPFGECQAEKHFFTGCSDAVQAVFQNISYGVI